MEGGLRLLKAKGAYVLGEVAADELQHPGAGQGSVRPEGAGLAAGVDSGVGAPGAVKLYRLFQQAGEQGLQLLLYGVGSVPLLLPAPIAAAVIAKAKFEISHRLTSVQRI